MKRKMFTTLVGIILCIWSMCSIVFADETTLGVQSGIEYETEIIKESSGKYIGELIPFNINMRGSSKPSSSSVKDLSDGTKYTFSFSAWNGKGVYSNYNFTGVSKMRLFINAVSEDSSVDSFDYTVKVYKRGSISDSCVATYTRNTDRDDETAMVFSVNASDKYYFKIITSRQMEGSGYIKKY